VFLLGKLIQCGGNPGGQTEHITKRNALYPFDKVLQHFLRLQGGDRICQKFIFNEKYAIFRVFARKNHSIDPYGGDFESKTEPTTKLHAGYPFDNVLQHFLTRPEGVYN